MLLRARLWDPSILRDPQHDKVGRILRCNRFLLALGRSPHHQLEEGEERESERMLFDHCSGIFSSADRGRAPAAGITLV
jgi:hypothetical protein